MDLNELANQINLATNLLSVDNHSKINKTHAQVLQNSDRGRLLLAARGLLSALEDPHKTIVEISKGVCVLVPVSALSEKHLSF